MAKIYLSADNSRGHPVTAANPSYAHLRGWHAGVETEVAGTEPDRFDVYMTPGSSGAGHRVYLGRVTETSDGPTWESAEFLASSADAYTSNE